MDGLIQDLLKLESNKTDKVRCLYIDKSELEAELPIHYPLDPDDLSEDNVELYNCWDPCQDLLIQEYAGKIFRPLTYNHSGKALRDDVERFMAPENYRGMSALKKRLLASMKEYVSAVKFTLDAVASAKAKSSVAPTKRKLESAQLLPGNIPKAPRIEPPIAPRITLEPERINRFAKVVHASAAPLYSILSDNIPTTGIKCFSNYASSQEVHISFGNIKVKLLKVTLEVKRVAPSWNNRRCHPGSNFNVFDVGLYGESPHLRDYRGNEKIGGTACTVNATGTLDFSLIQHEPQRDFWIVFSKVENTQLKFVVRQLNLYGNILE